MKTTYTYEEAKQHIDKRTALLASLSTEKKQAFLNAIINEPSYCTGSFANGESYKLGSYQYVSKLLEDPNVEITPDMIRHAISNIFMDRFAINEKRQTGEDQRITSIREQGLQMSTLLIEKFIERGGKVAELFKYESGNSIFSEAVFNNNISATKLLLATIGENIPNREEIWQQGNGKTILHNACSAVNKSNDLEMAKLIVSSGKMPGELMVSSYKPNATAYDLACIDHIDNPKLKESALQVIHTEIEAQLKSLEAKSPLTALDNVRYNKLFEASVLSLC